MTRVLSKNHLQKKHENKEKRVHTYSSLPVGEEVRNRLMQNSNIIVWDPYFPSFVCSLCYEVCICCDEFHIFEGHKAIEKHMDVYHK